MQESGCNNRSSFWNRLRNCKEIISAKTTNPDNPQSVIDKIADEVPVKKLGTPEQIGSLVAFLAGDNAEYITGTANVIDGGNMIPETSVMGVHSTE